MWHMGDGWGWWMLFGSIWMVAFWALVIWAIIAVISRTGGPARGAPPPDTPALSPLELLEQRYARGEIGHEEFEERRSRLLNRPPPG